MKKAEDLLADVKNAYVVGDSAYSSEPLRKFLDDRNCTIVIATNPTHRARNRDFDKALYKERRLIENLFQKLKRNRRVAMRFEKLARNFLAFVHLAAVLVWLV